MQAMQPVANNPANLSPVVGPQNKIQAKTVEEDKTTQIRALALKILGTSQSSDTLLELTCAANKCLQSGLIMIGPGNLRMYDCEDHFELQINWSFSFPCVRSIKKTTAETLPAEVESQLQSIKKEFAGSDRDKELNELSFDKELFRKALLGMDPTISAYKKLYAEGMLDLALVLRQLSKMELFEDTSEHEEADTGTFLK
jgi:hypothetical protein